MRFSCTELMLVCFLFNKIFCTIKLDEKELLSSSCCFFYLQVENIVFTCIHGPVCGFEKQLREVLFDAIKPLIWVTYREIDELITTPRKVTRMTTMKKHGTLIDHSENKQKKMQSQAYFSVFRFPV